MKRMLLILILCPVLCFAQAKKQTVKKQTTTVSKIDIATANVKKWFKLDYVDKKFKDPYSYKLMKVELNPFTKLMEYNLKIRELEQQEGNAAIGNDAIIEMYKQMINNADEGYLKQFEKYYVRLDAYGNNSLGNAVLGRYIFVVDLKGNLISEIQNLNED